MGLHAALISSIKLQSDRLEAQSVEPGSKVNTRNSGIKQKCHIFKQVRIGYTKGSLVFENPMLYTLLFLYTNLQKTNHDASMN